MSTLRLAVLGDSIAYGTGATRGADTLGPRLVAALEAVGVRVEHRVFAVPGAVSADLAVQVERARAWRPQLVVVVIGANDLTRLVPPERAAAALGVAVRTLARRAPRSCWRPRRTSASSRTCRRSSGRSSGRAAR
jgi:lysophospholipase L1-like esterase